MRRVGIELAPTNGPHGALVTPKERVSATESEIQGRRRLERRTSKEAALLMSDFRNMGSAKTATSSGKLQLGDLPSSALAVPGADWKRIGNTIAMSCREFGSGPRFVLQ